MTTPLHSAPEANLQQIAYNLLGKSIGFFLDYEQYRCRKSSGERDGTRVYYAVDYDVVHLYLAPRLDSDRANFLDGDHAEPSCVATAFLLGEYFFSPDRKRLDLSPMPTYLLTESHYEELLDGLAHFTDAAAATKLDFSEDAMDRLIQLSRDVLAKSAPENRSSNLVEGLSSNVMDLLNIYDIALGKFSALERFASIREGGLRKLDNVDWHSELKFNPLPDMEEPQDRQYMNKHVVDWTLRLRKAGKPKNIRNDALALATLQFANESLQKEKIDARFCLITGTSSIHTAAHEWDENFAHLYLRHPQAFLMDQDFFAPERPSATDAKSGDALESRTLKLFDWLNLCLPSMVKESLELHTRKINSKALSNITEKSRQDPAAGKIISSFAARERGGISDRDMIRSLKNQIETHAASVYGDTEKLSAVGSPEGAASRLAGTLIHLFEANSLNAESLRSAFDNELLSLLNNIYIEAGWYTIVQRNDGDTAAHRKGIPALCFDKGFENATKAKEKLLKYLGNETELDDKALKEIYKDITEQDRTKYHAYLIFALMFSLKGFWQPVSSLSERAIQIADGIQADSGSTFDQKKSLLKGREAAYLAAVAKRRLIRDATDLDKAASFLDEARRRISGNASDFPIRFESEELAIATRRILLEHYCALVSSDFPVPKTLEVMERTVRLIREGENEARTDVRNWIIRQGAINYLNLLVVQYVKGEDIREKSSDHRRILNMLPPLIEDKTAADSDPHACMIYLVGLAILSDDDSEFLRASARFECFMDTHGQMPYDAKRRMIFKKIIDSRRNEHKIPG